MIETKTAMDSALWYHTLGANVIPTNENKVPQAGWKAWQANRQNAEDVKALRIRGNLAIVHGVGGYSCIDFDGIKGPDGGKLPVREATVRIVVEALGLDFDTYRWIVVTPSQGYHVWLLTTDIKPQSFSKHDTSELHSDSLDHIEWKAEGTIALVPPSAYGGASYRFRNGDPEGVPAEVTLPVLDAALRLVLKEGVSLKSDSYHNGTNSGPKGAKYGNMVGYICKHYNVDDVSKPKKNGKDEWEVRIAEGAGLGGFHVLLTDKDDVSSGYCWNCFRDVSASGGDHIGGGEIGGGWADLIAYLEYGKLYKEGTPLSTLTTAEKRAVAVKVKDVTGATPKEIAKAQGAEIQNNEGPQGKAREGKATHPEWLREWKKLRGISVRYNELKYRVEYKDGSGQADGERWDTIQNADLCSWASDYEDYTRKPIAPGRLGDYLTAEGMKNLYDPIRSYFDDLPQWDGVTNHISELAAFLPMEDPALWEVHLTKWMMGAYGCGYYSAWHGGYKNELFLILHGGQGVGKTFFVENLIPKKLHAYMYTGTVTEDKDSLLTQSQHWILNHEELESLTRVDQNHIKKLLSARDHTVRPPYGRVEETRKRRISFIGSTNEHGFLTDTTGSRRYLIHSVVDTGISDESRTALQLFDVSRAWAQAKALLERSIGTHYLNKEEEAEASVLNARYELERIEDHVVKKYIDLEPYGITKQYYSATEVAALLESKLSESDKRLVSMDKGFPQRLGKALSKAGLKKNKVRTGKNTAWKYLVGFVAADGAGIDTASEDPLF